MVTAMVTAAATERGRRGCSAWEGARVRAWTYRRFEEETGGQLRVSFVACLSFHWALLYHLGHS